MDSSPYVAQIFARVVEGPDEGIDLGVAALLIASVARPALDIAHYVGILDRLADDIRVRSAADRLGGLRRILFTELGFRGNLDDYYDPRNSFLDEVLERRTGIPITLSVVVLEIGRRLDLDVHGVGFPGHFLVRADGQLLDPFAGARAVTEGELELKLRAMFGPEAQLTSSMLAPTGKRDILVRMLNNLRGIYQHHERHSQPQMARRCFEQFTLFHERLRAASVVVAPRRN